MGMVIFQPTWVVHLTVKIVSTFIFLSTFHEQVCLHVFINNRKFTFVSRTHSFVSLGLPVVPRGVLGISSDGDDRMEPKVKTQKNP